jgi:hypothetical protein
LSSLGTDHISVELVSEVSETEAMPRYYVLQPLIDLYSFCAHLKSPVRLKHVAYLNICNNEKRKHQPKLHIDR